MTRTASMPRHALMALGLFVIVLVAYWPSSIGLWKYWMAGGGNTSDGLLVALISVWLLFRSREALATAPVRPVSWVLPVVLVCSVGSMLFWRAGIETFQLALLPALILVAVLGAMGTQTARIVAFPVGFLYFAVPGWGELWPILQLLTIRCVSIMAPLVGVPARVSGDIVTLPGVGVFEIGSLCSGVEFFVVGLAVAALIGELERASLKRRAWLMVLMGVVAIVSNWARVLLIIAIGYATDMRNPLATSDHLLFGWIIFAAALLLFLWLAPRSAPPAHRVTQSVGGAMRVHASGAVVEYLVAITALAIFPACIYGMGLVWDSDVPTMVEMPFPAGQASWRGPFVAADALWQPQFVGPHSQRCVVYEGPAARSVEVMAIGYSRQEQGRELVSEVNSLVGKRGLTAIAYDQAVGDGERFRELVAEDGAGHRSLIWWVYDVGGRRFATPIYSQLWYGLNALIRPPYSVLYAFKTVCEHSSCAAARVTLENFVESNGGGLFTAALRPQPDRRPSHA